MGRRDLQSMRPRNGDHQRADVKGVRTRKAYRLILQISQQGVRLQFLRPCLAFVTWGVPELNRVPADKKDTCVRPGLGQVPPRQLLLLGRQDLVIPGTLDLDDQFPVRPRSRAGMVTG